MMRAVKLLVVLVLLGFAALIAFAYLGDMSPQTQETRQPVTLNGG